MQLINSIIERVLNGEKPLYEVIVRRFNPYLYKIGRIKTDKKIVEMLENSVKQDVPYISDYF